MKSIELFIRNLVSKVRRDVLEHVFVSVLFLWVLMWVFVLLGVNAAMVAFLIYCVIVILWEFFGSGEFDFTDIVASIVPILPAVIFMLS